MLQISDNKWLSMTPECGPAVRRHLSRVWILSVDQRNGIDLSVIVWMSDQTNLHFQNSGKPHKKVEKLEIFFERFHLKSLTG